MDSVDIQLRRLRRHYDECVRSYDDISLLELSHVLRIWADLKDTLHDEFRSFKTTISFKTAIPPKKVTRAVHTAQYILAFIPESVVTYATSSHIASGPEVANGKSHAHTVSVAFKLLPDGGMELRNFCASSIEFDDATRKILDCASVKRCNYIQWLGAEIVRLGYEREVGQITRLGISREALIRRVANTLDGSHPSASAKEEHVDTENDPAIRHLLQFKVGGLPLPYFLLLKVAQDILTVAPRLLRT